MQFERRLNSKRRTFVVEEYLVASAESHQVERSGGGRKAADDDVKALPQ
jgi:hypothetical protein